MNESHPDSFVALERCPRPNHYAANRHGYPDCEVHVGRWFWPHPDSFVALERCPRPNHYAANRHG
jgi:hypothetical protein